jgi:hypothetical protein
MALLGVALPNLRGRQVALDLFPEVSRQKATRPLGTTLFEEFLIVRLHKIEQANLWQGFQRVLRMAVAPCLNAKLCEELLLASHEEFSRSRNRFLYKVPFWPLEDLTVDANSADLLGLVGTELDVDSKGFLLRLSFSVYHLFEQLIGDLGEYSATVKEQVTRSRFLSDPEGPEIAGYGDFLSRIVAGD